MKIGVSHKGIIELLVSHPYVEIERQLAFLPFRKAKRPEALIIEAIRHNYSPPKEFYYAKDKAQPAPAPDAVDEGSEPPDSSAPANTHRHGAEDPLDPPQANDRLEQA
ncbi:MAG: hypothetical protein JST30_01410 [Armatimonadetes bacterium]|nr:hypothetical protein [Armatimonadota bacterium]